MTEGWEQLYPIQAIILVLLDKAKEPLFYDELCDGLSPPYPIPQINDGLTDLLVMRKIRFTIRGALELCDEQAEMEEELHW